MEIEANARALDSFKHKTKDEINQKISVEREKITKQLEKNVRGAKARAVSASKKRDKEKERQVRKYIDHSTKEFKLEKTELLRRNKADMRLGKVPTFFNKSWFFRLFMPASFADAGLIALWVIFLNLILPFIIYLLVPNRQSWHFFLIMPFCVLFFLSIYMELYHLVVGKHKEVMMRCRERMIMVRNLKKKIVTTKSDILQLDDESNYALEKQDTRLVIARQDLELATTEQRSEITRFENEVARDIAKGFEDKARNHRMELEEKIAYLTREKNLSLEMAGELQLALVEEYGAVLGADNLNTVRVSRMLSWLQAGEEKTLEDCILRVRTNGS